MTIALNKIKAKMKSYFGQDRKRILHALSVADYAKQILAKEPADEKVVLAAAYLHDIGIHEAERKYNSTSAHYQQIEGPLVARGILQALSAEDGFVNENFINDVCKIIALHHTLNGLPSLEFQILYEADWIVNLQSDFKHYGKEKKQQLIKKNFKTTTGKQLVLKEVLSR